MKPAFAITMAFAALAGAAQAEVKVTPNIARTVVTFDVTSSDPGGKVSGIHIDKNAASCSVPSTDASPNRSEAGVDTVKTLSTPHWVVTCMRKSITAGNETVYLPFDIAFETSTGPLTFSVRADAQLPYPTAADLQEQITAAHRRFGKIQLQGVRSGAPDKQPPRCASGTYDTGYTAMFILPIGSKGQSHFTRVCISVPE